MNYQKVSSSSDLKAHGNIKKGILYLNEGIYTTFSPEIDNDLVVKFKKENKETTESIENEIR